MAHSPSTEGALLTTDEQDVLLELAETSIYEGLAGRNHLRADIDALPPRLREPHGAFVTLHVRSELNGCIGRLETDDPLGALVPLLAFESAFGDPRLPALQHYDVADLHIEISVLTPLDRMTVRDRDDLLAQLRPGIDGVLIRAFPYQATFLPAVWASAPDPDFFLDLLFRKAGLPPGSWPPDLQVYRYEAALFGRAATARG